MIIHPPIEIDTYEEIQGVQRTTMHIYVTNTGKNKVFYSESGETLGSADYNEYSGFKRRGGLDGEEKFKDENFAAYCAYWFVIYNAIGTGSLGMATYDRHPLTGKEITKIDKAALLIGGVLDFVSLGKGSGGVMVLKNFAKEKLGEALAERLIDVSFTALGLDKKQEAMLGYHLARAIYKGKAGDIENIIDLTTELVGLGLKGKDVVNKYMEILNMDLNMPLNADEVFSEIQKKYLEKNKKENQSVKEFKSTLEDENGEVTEKDRTSEYIY